MDYPLKIAEQLRPQLKALRKQLGMTQAKLGEAVGVTQARVVEIEANPGAVSLQQVMQVLGALGATVVIRAADTGHSKGHQGAGTAPVAGEGADGSAQTPKKGSW